MKYWVHNGASSAPTIPSPLHSSWEKHNDVDEQKLNGFRRRVVAVTLTYICHSIDGKAITFVGYPIHWQNWQI